MKKKKKILLGILVMMLLSIGSVWQPKAVSAADTIIGDDYPAKWKNLPLGGTADSWGLFTRYCTSFVANRLSVANKFELPRAYGDATVWGNRAQSQGYRVDMNPVRGSVAWWQGSKNHVAWVAAVDGNRVLIEEYNNPFDSGAYNNRWINKNAVDGYIHFKDMKPTKKFKVGDRVKIKRTTGQWVGSSALTEADYQRSYIVEGYNANGAVTIRIPGAWAGNIREEDLEIAENIFSVGDQVKIKSTTKQWVGSSLLNENDYNRIYLVESYNLDGSVTIRIPGSWAGKLWEYDLEKV